MASQISQAVAGGITPPDAGHVVAARGSVLDVEFQGDLPAIREALAVEWEAGAPLIAEVQQHLDPRRVRAVALQGTGGLKRGTRVRRLGAPVRVPVGQAVLGRLLNVLGETTDRGPAFPAVITRRPIHGPAPALERQRAARERFHTGAYGQLYTADLSAARPAEHYTARVVPHRDGVQVPLESQRILWQR